MNVKENVDRSLNIIKMVSLNLQDSSHNKFFRRFSNRRVIGEHLNEQLLVIERYIKSLEGNKVLSDYVNMIQNIDIDDKGQRLMYHMISCVSEFVAEMKGECLHE